MSVQTSNDLRVSVCERKRQIRSREVERDIISSERGTEVLQFLRQVEKEETTPK